MKFYIMILLRFISVTLSFYSIYGMFSLINTARKLKTKSYDEFERKTIFDSLGYSMIFIIIVHILEYIIVTILYFKIPDFQYIPIITAVKEPGSIFTDSSIFNKIFFDCAIVSIIYTSLKYKYGLIDKDKILSPIITCVILSALLTLPLLIVHFY